MNGHDEETYERKERKQDTKEYRAWKSMKARCYNPNTKAYKNYGGRGIKVCLQWLVRYEYFLDDMGRAPSHKHSLDRIDNNGNYEPINCRWATKLEQCNNMRKNVLVTMNGETKTVSQWCRDLKLNHRVIFNRLRNGVTKVEELFLKDKLPRPTPRTRTVICPECNRVLNSMGLATHRAMHRRRKQEANGQ